MLNNHNSNNRLARLFIQLKKYSIKILPPFIFCFLFNGEIYSQNSPIDSLLNSKTDSIKLIPGKDSTVTFQSSLHPYKINGWVSGSISLVGTIGDYYAIPRILGKEKISDEELSTLNPGVLTRFDRWALMQDPIKRVYFDHLSDQVITGIFILPVTLALDKNIRHDGLKLLLMYYESQAITFSIFNYSPLGPTFQNKFRPMAYYTDIPIGDRNIGNNRNSFFAGHVSSATAASFFLVKVFCDYHPNIGVKKYLLYTAAVIPAAAMGYLRLRALKHFPSDILVGMSVGAICGVAIPSLHAKKYKNLKLSIFTSPKGATGFCANWNFASIRE